MRVKINEDLYDVKFWFQFREDKYGRTKNPLKDTRCTISTVDEEKKGPSKYNCIGEGLALLSHKDRFDKYAGKKLAFTRALISTFNKEDRTEFWRIYKEQNTGRKIEAHVKM